MALYVLLRRWLRRRQQARILAAYNKEVANVAVMDRALKALPTRTVTAADAAVGVECAVCLDALAEGDEIRSLPCGHEFHTACVDHWFSKRLTTRTEAARSDAPATAQAVKDIMPQCPLCKAPCLKQDSAAARPAAAASTEWAGVQMGNLPPSPPPSSPPAAARTPTEGPRRTAWGLRSQAQVSPGPSPPTTPDVGPIMDRSLLQTV